MSEFISPAVYTGSIKAPILLYYTSLNVRLRSHSLSRLFVLLSYFFMRSSTLIVCLSLSPTKTKVNCSLY